MKKKKTKILEEFSGAGYRVTKAREKILAVFSEAGRHISADDVYLAVKKKGEHVGITTIYRAVDSLAKAGILRQISLKDRIYYEMIDRNISGHHHHLICRKCKMMMDYSDFVDEEIKLIRRLEEIVSKVHKFKVEDHQISFTGLCKMCK